MSSPPLTILENAPSTSTKWAMLGWIPSSKGGFPPQVNKHMHPEVPTGMLTQPSWHPRKPPSVAPMGCFLCINVEYTFSGRRRIRGLHPSTRRKSVHHAKDVILGFVL